MKNETERATYHTGLVPSNAVIFIPRIDSINTIIRVMISESTIAITLRLRDVNILTVGSFVIY